jgi:predicted phosphoribosyltransferase
MERNQTERIFSLAEMTDRVGVFRDRAEAGDVLARMLGAYARSDAILLAIPAGGVPVAARIASALQLPLDVAVVSKMTPPWNSEIGYGAVAFDGSVIVNDLAAADMGLSADDIAAGVRQTTAKVQRRLRALRGDRPMPGLAGRTVLLVDDGLASGFTMLTAVAAIRRAGATAIVLAVPTAHADAIARVVDKVDALHCPNIRHGWRFAVADAYHNWVDVQERQAAAILRVYAVTIEPAP